MYVNVNQLQPMQIIAAQTSIRAKKRILGELLLSVPCEAKQQLYRNKLAQINTSSQLDQLAVDIITKD